MVRISYPSSTTTCQPFAGLCAGRVRVIFDLPPHLHPHAHPLLYVEWFRPFRGPAQHTALYTTSHSTQNRTRRHSIVCASSLIRTCHLVPIHGNDPPDPDLTPYNALDKSLDFVLNTYGDFHMFHALTSVTPINMSFCYTYTLVRYRPLKQH